MAAELPESDLARELFDAASAEGLDLRTALRGDDETLRRTDVAQPALVFVECVLWSLLQPAAAVAVAGHSVGEYAACVAAGALAPADALRLVIARGRGMAAMHEGTMSALIGVDADAVARMCEDVTEQSGEVVVVANINAPEQVVISGTAAAVTAVSERARAAGARRAIPLNVSGAFHSPLMARAAGEFARLLDAADIRDPQLPVVCNVDGQAVRERDGLRDRLRRQLTSPVRWVDCVRTLLSLGADTLVEVGPGTVLTGLARRTAPSVSARTVNDAAAAASFTTHGAAL